MNKYFRIFLQHLNLSETVIECVDLFIMTGFSGAEISRKLKKNNNYASSKINHFYGVFKDKLGVLLKSRKDLRKYYRKYRYKLKSFKEEYSLEDDCWVHKKTRYKKMPDNIYFNLHRVKYIPKYARSGNRRRGLKFERYKILE